MPYDVWACFGSHDDLMLMCSLYELETFIVMLGPCPKNVMNDWLLWLMDDYGFL
jgi:hypothetical protein